MFNATGTGSGGTISNNFISQFSASATGGIFYGLMNWSGTNNTYSNNIISLGGAVEATIYGFGEPGSNPGANLYFNTFIFQDHVLVCLSLQQ